MKIVYQNQEIQIRIIKSDRKTITLKVEEDGEVEMRVPLEETEEALQELALKKAAWIVKAQKKILEKREKRKNISYEDGARLLFEGEEYILKVEEDKTRLEPKITMEKNIIKVSVFTINEKYVEHVMLHWYYQNAQAKIAHRIRYYKPLIGKEIGQVQIKEQKSRWGSCSAKGDLYFTWKLILLPPDLLDYVVIHELCHRKEMNHSKEFWNEVEKIIPDYKLRRKRLREFE